VVTKQTLVNIFSISYSTRMLTKLGAYLDQQPIKRTIRFTAPSGEKFVVMPVKEYTMLTGIDVDTLPMAEIPDSISEGARETDSSAHTRNTETDTSGEFGRFSALAHIPLEEEIGVDKLPL
jgi:hypothetical protein